MKSDILEQIQLFLLKRRFTVKQFMRGCFDIIARYEGQILLIKVLEDANSISSQVAHEMSSIASYVGGSPMIIADKAGEALQDNVVYARFSIATLNSSTFRNCIDNRYPIIRRSKAGLTCSLDGDALRKAREREGMSLGSLARKVGVSARMISKYEHGSSEVTLRKALTFHSIFGEIVFEHLNVFKLNPEIMSDGSSDVSKKYVELGFDASEANRAPFDVIAKKERDIILTEVGDKPKKDMPALSRLFEADTLTIYNKKKPKRAAALTKKEFLDFKKSDELIKFVKESVE